MYNVSNSYREAVEKGYFKGRVSGTMTLESGRIVTIDDANIINGSLSINNKCVNNSEFCLGAVYVGQMSVTLYHPDIDRYSLYNAQIQLSYFLTLEDGTEEEVPLGVFFVDKPSRSKKLIQLKCYDAMTKFDVSVAEDSWGSPFALLTLVCEKIGVPLANTEEEILAMCNGDKDFSLNSTRVNTYRDFLSYISMVLGGFATINRLGQLEIRQFHTVPDLSITARRRTSSTVNDYETYFNSVRARFVAEQNFYPYVETDDTMTTGLLLDMGDVPIVQGLEEFKHEVLQNVLTVVKGIRYVPSDFKMSPDPSIDLGDGLTLERVNNTSESVFILVTGYTWSYHKEQSVTSNGTDALLPNVSDSSKKQMDSIQSQIESKNLVVKTYVNPEDIEIKGTDETVIRMSWSAFENTTAIFFATVPVEMYADGYIVFTYMRSLEQIGQLTKYLPRGKHFLTFTNYIASEANENVTLIVRARTEYFESDLRKQEAKILSLKDWIDHQTVKTTTTTSTTSTVTDEETGEITSTSTSKSESVFNYSYVEKPVDTSVPEAFIGMGEVKATVFAQGLNATAGWDGTLEFSEDIRTISLKGMDVAKLTDSVTMQDVGFNDHGITEKVGTIKLNRFGLLKVNDHFGSGSIKLVVDTQTVMFKNLTDYVTNEDGVLKLKTEYQYNSNPETIDEGQMVSVQAITTDKVSVESVVVSHE